MGTDTYDSVGQVAFWPTIEALVAGIAPQNLHAEVSFGPHVGREAWSCLKGGGADAHLDQ